jgi:hypothetical protein
MAGAVLLWVSLREVVVVAEYVLYWSIFAPSWLGASSENYDRTGDPDVM